MYVTTIFLERTTSMNYPEM